MTIRLDHLVVAARSLPEGVAWVEKRLGAAPAGGGRHVSMGTHNALWGLGSCYLEVIAPDPEGRRPDRPRWFGFDDPRVVAALETGPALVTWAVATDTEEVLAALVEAAPAEHDAPTPFARDDLRWLVALPRGRSLPAGGAWPLAIHWIEGRHPAQRLPDQRLSLKRLEISGRGVAPAREALGEVDGPVVFLPSDQKTTLRAEITTRNGTAVL